VNFFYRFTAAAATDGIDAQLPSSPGEFLRFTESEMPSADRWDSSDLPTPP
jgi:hypothetical protein